MLIFVLKPNSQSELNGGTYGSSSHHWRPHSQPSGYTCWSWRCSFRLCTGIDRLSTAWLTHMGGKDSVQVMKHEVFQLILLLFQAAKPSCSPLK